MPNDQKEAVVDPEAAPVSKALVPLAKVPNDMDLERKLVAEVYLRGPAALFDKGYTQEAAAEFIQRPHIVDAFSALSAEQRHEDVLLGRARFLAKRTLVGMIPDATDLLRQALNGPVYARDVEGHIRNDGRGNPIMDQRVDSAQFAAAVEILNRIGVHHKEPPTPDANGNILFTSQSDARRAIVDQSANLTEEQRVISRERMRAIITVLSPKLAAIKKAITKEAPKVMNDMKPKPAKKLLPAPPAPPAPAVKLKLKPKRAAH